MYYEKLKKNFNLYLHLKRFQNNNKFMLSKNDFNRD